MDKTREEIEDLKKSWLSDPIWDLEGTEGFEDQREELLSYRLSWEKEWGKRSVARTLSEMVEIKMKEVNELKKAITFLLEGI